MFARGLVIGLAAVGALIIVAGLILASGCFYLLFNGDGLVLQNGAGLGPSLGVAAYVFLLHSALGTICLGLAQQINQTRAR